MGTFTRKPIIKFDALTDTGVDKLPLGSTVTFTDSTGNNALIEVLDITGYDETTTLQTFLSTPSNYKFIAKEILGSPDFSGLADTPGDYAGESGKALLVNATEDGLLYGDVSYPVYSEGDEDSFPTVANNGATYFNTTNNILYTRYNGAWYSKQETIKEIAGAYLFEGRTKIESPFDPILKNPLRNDFTRVQVSAEAPADTFNNITLNGDLLTALTSTLENVKIKQVSASDSFTMALLNNGDLYAVGRNNKGQLGLGNTSTQYNFVKVPTSNVKEVSCGYQHTLIVKNDGTVWGTGYNSNGQLGVGDSVNKTSFTQTNATDTKSIACGYYHSIILKNDGTVWSTGSNGYGQLSLATDATLFTQTNTTDTKSIACGSDHSIIVKNDGTVWSTGRNNYGQLGVGDSVNKTSFTQTNATDTKSVSCGLSHSIILKNDGTVWSTGYNVYGQLGLGDTTNRNVFTQVSITDTKSIACGLSHSIILKNDGTVWSTGYNVYGQLGLGDIIDRTSFTDVGFTSVDGLFSNSFYSYSSFFLKEGGLFAVGYNNYGQLGDGTTADKSSAVEVTTIDVTGTFYSSTFEYFDLVSDTLTFASTDNITNITVDAYSSQDARIIDATNAEGFIFGDGSKDMDGNYIPVNAKSVATKEYVDNLPSSLVTLDDTPSSLTSQQGKALLVNASEDAFEFGSVAYPVYTEGDELSFPTAPNNGDTYLNQTNNILYTWYNDKWYSKENSIKTTVESYLYEGIYGTDLTAPITKNPLRPDWARISVTAQAPSDTFTNITLNGNIIIPISSELRDIGVSKVAYGDYHCIVLLDNGDIWGTGNNYYGQLGDGTTTDKATLIKLPESNVIDIACGAYFTMILKNDGTLWGAGNNSRGQLGLGNTTNKTSFTQSNITDIKSVSCGNEFTMVVKNDGTLWGAGYNGYGQLGDGSTTQTTSFKGVNTNVKSVSCGNEFVIILKNDGTVWGTGYNGYGQFGSGSSTSTNTTQQQISITDTKSIACGNNFSLILKNDGTVWSAGYNVYGQLGLGNTATIIVFTQTPIADAKSIACGSDHSIILKNDGTVYTAGQNNYGQLGYTPVDNTLFGDIGVTGISKISKNSPKGDSSSIITDNGTLFSFGENLNGQLGIGNFSNQGTPVEITAPQSVGTDYIADFGTIDILTDTLTFASVDTIDRIDVKGYSYLDARQIDVTNPEGFIFGDGSHDMDGTYVPSQPKSVATKEYVDTKPSTFGALTDTPASFTGQAGKAAIVNVAEDGIEYGSVTADFIGLTDTASSFSGKAGQMPIVNAGEDSLDFTDAMVILADGTVTVPLATVLSIDTAGLSALVTKEWALANAYVPVSNVVLNEPITAATSGKDTFVVNFPVDEKMLLMVDGIIQDEGTYSVVGSVITLDNPLLQNQTITIFRGESYDAHYETVTQSSGYIITPTFTLREGIIVFIDGVLQDTGAYSVSGNDITMLQDLTGADVKIISTTFAYLYRETSANLPALRTGFDVTFLVNEDTILFMDGIYTDIPSLKDSSTNTIDLGYTIADGVDIMVLRG